MKLSKEELKQKVIELVTDNEIAIPLLEYIEDSIEVDTTKIDELQAKINDLQEKYKKRFFKRRWQKRHRRQKRSRRRIRRKRISRHKRNLIF